MDYSKNGEGAAETSVGISSYANNAPGFQGIMKQRYSDFVVREVGLDGTVSGLRNTRHADLENLHFNPNKASFSEIEDSSNDQLVESVINEISLITGGVFGGAPLNPLVPSESSLEELKAFLFACLEKLDECPATITACPCPDKLTRTKLHQMVRKYLSAYVESEALEVEGAKFILLRSKHKMQKGTSGDWRSRNKWPENLGSYLQFTLLKENIDTMSAAHVIAKLLGCKVDSIQYAGTKDKRALTSQKVTMYRRKPSDLSRLNAFNLPPYIRVGDYEYVNEGMKLGGLAGNNFGIIMRDIDSSTDDIKAACKRIGESGFINYFGLQRFGSGGTKSHISGIALFKQDWKLAVELLFASRDGDKPEMLEMKEAFRQKKYQKALHVTSYKMPSERSVLESLIKNPEDYAGAYNRIAKNQWLICLHAYQSYVWNKAASERILKYGMICVIGDLVALGELDFNKGVEELIVDDEIEDGDRTVKEEPLNLDTDKKETNFPKEESASNEGKKVSSIHVITQQDIDSNRYSILDVILPLPGHDISLPENTIGQYILDVLAEDGFSLEFFRICQPSSHRMNGAYRKLIQMPANFEWNFFEYSDPNEELVPTEASYLRQMKLDTKKRRNDKSLTEIPTAYSTDSKPYQLTNLSVFSQVEVQNIYGPGDDSEEEKIDSIYGPGGDTVEEKISSIYGPGDSTEDAKEGMDAKSKKVKLKGVQLKFTLPPGTYATMLIREITKHSTSSQYQTQLTATAAASVVSDAVVIDDNIEEYPSKKSRIEEDSKSSTFS